MKVLITIDTEVYPIRPTWREERLLKDIDRDIYGLIGNTETGLRHQLRLLQQCNLKASFFVEPLFALAPDVGHEPLRRIVTEIQDHHQEVQMHLHPEWVPELPREIDLTERKSDILTAFAPDDQAELIRIGLENLYQCGTTHVSAFRAGDYAANFDTLRALSSTGITFDTSYNYCYLDTSCGLRGMQPLYQPEQVGDVWEIPISYFQDYPGHFRHAQVCACSLSEMITALERAEDNSWQYFVIVSHSFEFIKHRRSLGVEPSVNRIAERRFDGLCAFLSDNRKRFQTEHFNNIDINELRTEQTRKPLKGRLAQTCWRLYEQAWNRAIS